MLEGKVWTITECDEKDVVIFNGKCKFKEGKIVYLSEKPPVEFGDKIKIGDSESAYFWATDIGNQDIMIDKITDSEYAYYWARDIGNQDIMIDRITNSEYAYWLAVDIGDKDIMIKKFPEIKELLKNE